MAEMTYILIWCYWLPEHGPKSGKYIIAKFGQLTRRDPSEGVKYLLNLHSLTWRQEKIKRKTAQISYIWFRVHWLPEHAPKSAQYLFTKLDRLTETDPKEGAKIILKFFFLSQKKVIRKEQTTLWKEEKNSIPSIYHFGCTGWQSTPQNLFNNSLLILTQRPILRTNEGPSNSENCKNALYTILGAPVCRARHKIC